MQTTPIFGSASTFGTGSGFGGFTGVSAAAKSEDKNEEAEEEAPEEECAAEFQPVVQLDEVEVATGEEDEDCLVDMYVHDLNLLCKMLVCITDGDYILWLQKVQAVSFCE